VITFTICYFESVFFNLLSVFFTSATIGVSILTGSLLFPLEGRETSFFGGVILFFAFLSSFFMGLGAFFPLLRVLATFPPFIGVLLYFTSSFG
jgi:hypothetical protein